MGSNHWEWERMGLKKIFPLISTLCYYYYYYYHYYVQQTILVAVCGSCFDSICYWRSFVLRTKHAKLRALKMLIWHLKEPYFPLLCADTETSARSESLHYNDPFFGSNARLLPWPGSNQSIINQSKLPSTRPKVTDKQKSTKHGEVEKK